MNRVNDALKSWVILWVVFIPLIGWGQLEDIFIEHNQIGFFANSQ